MHLQMKECQNYQQLPEARKRQKKKKKKKKDDSLMPSVTLALLTL
jgi:hypothetical protein